MKLKLYCIDGGKHPILGKIYYRCQKILADSDDENQLERYERYLAHTLSAYAQTIDDCNCIFKLINNVEENIQPKASFNGNDVEISISERSVQINININEDWIDQPEGQFSLSEFKTVLTAWRDFLKLPESLESEIIVEI